MAIKEAIEENTTLIKAHDLRLFSVAGLPGIICLQCGAVTTKWVKKLHGMCKGGTSSDRGDEAISRCRRDLQPDPKQVTYDAHQKIDNIWVVDGVGPPVGSISPGSSWRWKVRPTLTISISPGSSWRWKTRTTLVNSISPGSSWRWIMAWM